MFERYQDFGIWLFFDNGIISGIVALGIDIGPCADVARSLFATVVEPFRGVDFVVYDKISDAPMAVEAVEIMGNKAGETPVMPGTFFSGGTEIGGCDEARITGYTSPRRWSVNDGRDDEAGIAIGLDGLSDGGCLTAVDGKAITIIKYLTGSTCAALGWLPEFPDKIHGHTGTFITDDLIWILEIRLYAFDTFALWISERCRDTFASGTCLTGAATATIERTTATIADRTAVFALGDTRRRRTLAEIGLARLRTRTRATIEYTTTTIADRAAVFALGGTRRRRA